MCVSSVVFYDSSFRIRDVVMYWRGTFIELQFFTITYTTVGTINGAVATKDKRGKFDSPTLTHTYTDIQRDRERERVAHLAHVYRHGRVSRLNRSGSF